MEEATGMQKTMVLADPMRPQKQRQQLVRLQHPRPAYVLEQPIVEEEGEEEEEEEEEEG